MKGLSIEDSVAVGLVATVAVGAVSPKLGKQAAPLYLRRNLQPDGAQQTVGIRSTSETGLATMRACLILR